MSHGKVVVENDVNEVLASDGINAIDLTEANNPLMRALDISVQGSWARRVIYNERFAAHLICQEPGETNRTHYHANDDEWWVVLKGEINWWIEGEPLIHAKAGDIVFARRGRQHKIRTVGESSSLRLAISPPDIPHFHPETDFAPDDF